jgi:hypothetical protein
MIQTSSGTVCYLFHAGCLLGLLTDLEDGGSMFLQNASKHLPDYSTLQSHYLQSTQHRTGMYASSKYCLPQAVQNLLCQAVNPDKKKLFAKQ